MQPRAICSFSHNVRQTSLWLTPLWHWRARQHLEYCPSTGSFTCQKGYQHTPGSEAGLSPVSNGYRYCHLLQVGSLLSFLMSFHGRDLLGLLPLRGEEPSHPRLTTSIERGSTECPTATTNPAPLNVHNSYGAGQGPFDGNKLAMSGSCTSQSYKPLTNLLYTGPSYVSISPTPSNRQLLASSRGSSAKQPLFYLRSSSDGWAYACGQLDCAEG